MHTEPLQFEAHSEIWPLKEAFVISRGAKTAAHVVVVTIGDGATVGRGECVPYARYGETVDSVINQIRDVSGKVSSREHLRQVMKPGAARNAIDCAFWDLEAKRSGRRAADLAGVANAASVVTAYTLSLGSAEMMAAKAAQVRDMPLLKLKLGGDGDGERMIAVRRARPDARLIVDANEAWKPEQLVEFIGVASACNVEVVEQPLPAGHDEALASIDRAVPICADESLHTAADLPALLNRYDALNVKLDKAGGLTEALELIRDARAHNLKIMIGSMVGTSLGVAPALLLASQADWMDVDGPLLLATDRQPGLQFQGARVFSAGPSLWG